MFYAGISGSGNIRKQLFSLLLGVCKRRVVMVHVSGLNSTFLANFVNAFQCSEFHSNS